MCKFRTPTWPAFFLESIHCLLSHCALSSSHMGGNKDFLYLWSKVVCLFCFVPMRSTEPRCFRSLLWSLWKALDEKGLGVHGLGSMAFGLAVQKFLNIEWFLLPWKFRRIWNVPWLLFERSWWTGFSGIYLVRFGFRRMWEILIFKWFL
jgi:hypothetical protein